MVVDIALSLSRPITVGLLAMNQGVLFMNKQYALLRLVANEPQFPEAALE